MATESQSTSYDETLDEIEESLGIVPGYFSHLNDEDLVNEWPNFKESEFNDMADHLQSQMSADN